MSNIKRKNISPAPSPANWHSFNVGSLVVYREAQDNSYNKPVKNNVVDDHGRLAYTEDGRNHEYFVEGEQPEGYELVKVHGTERVERTKRGDISNVQIVEEDAEGAAIARGLEGYAELSAFGSDAMRSLAEANAETVGVAYNDAVVALQNLAEAIYAAVK